MLLQLRLLQQHTAQQPVVFTTNTMFLLAGHIFELMLTNRAHCITQIFLKMIWRASVFECSFGNDNVDLMQNAFQASPK